MKNALVLPEFESIEELDSFLVTLIEVDYNAARMMGSAHFKECNTNDPAPVRITETRPFTEAICGGSSAERTQDMSLKERMKELDEMVEAIANFANPRFRTITTAEVRAAEEHDAAERSRLRREAQRAREQAPHIAEEVLQKTPDDFYEDRRADRRQRREEEARNNAEVGRIAEEALLAAPNLSE